MQEAIAKSIVTITILHPANDRVDGTTLEDISYQIGDGGWLGTWCLDSTVPVPPEQVAQECINVGNDGTFFDDPE